MATYENIFLTTIAPFPSERGGETEGENTHNSISKPTMYFPTDEGLGRRRKNTSRGWRIKIADSGRE